MAGGDRNSKGKATDIVYHLVLSDKSVDDVDVVAVCGRKNPKLISSKRYPGPVTCKRCLSKLNVKFFDSKGSQVQPEQGSFSVTIEDEHNMYLSADFDLKEDIKPTTGEVVTIQITKENYGGNYQKEKTEN